MQNTLEFRCGFCLADLLQSYQTQTGGGYIWLEVLQLSLCALCVHSGVRRGD